MASGRITSLIRRRPHTTKLNNSALFWLLWPALRVCYHGVKLQVKNEANTLDTCRAGRSTASGPHLSAFVALTGSSASGRSHRRCDPCVTFLPNYTEVSAPELHSVVPPGLLAR